MADLNTLKTDAGTIRDASQQNENTAFRIGSWLLELIAFLEENGLKFETLNQEIADAKKQTEDFVAAAPYSVVDDSKVWAITDANGRALVWINPDGSFDWAKGVPSKIYNLINPILNDVEKINQAISTINSDNYIELTLDKNGRLLGGRKSDGSHFEQKLEANSLVVKKSLVLGDKAFSDLERELKSRGIGASTSATPVDWSNSNSINIPNQPKLALVNISNVSALPTTKTDDLNGIVEFWDLQGNYFKKKGILNAQGSSSMFYPKKNLAIDFVDDEWVGDVTPSIKFGKWVPQDSFHLKAYYTDAFRGICAIAYKLWDQVKASRGILNDRPYKQLYVSQFSDVADGYHEPADLNKNFSSEARCFPDGFPMLLFINGNFYGVYSWQLKKHRDNMMQNKKTAEHIHLDLGTSSPWCNTSGALDWTKFEIRNPKSLFYQSPQVVNGASTLEYDGDTPAEIMGEDSSYYDSSNKDHVRCAKVKNHILQTRNDFANLQALKKNGASNEEIRAKISSMFDVDSVIDYNIMMGVCGNGDGQKRNIQWATWDGKKWAANPYDWDSLFGIGLTGIPRNASPFCYFLCTDQGEDMPYWWVHTYFFEEEKARYHELRSKGIISVENFIKEISNWIYQIGAANLAKEFEKWSESPGWRDSHLNGEFWELADHKAFGSTPSGEEYNASKSYTVGDICYYGKGSEIYKFSCVKEATGKAPITQFYSQSPMCLGYHESTYRVKNWLEKVIAWYDSSKAYNYTNN